MSQSTPETDLLFSSCVQGELVFVTSKECRNVSPKDAEDYILGYTVGNDLSCRMYQLPRYSAGQFFFAKAFDKFAPIGPTLISAAVFADAVSFTVVTRVNGEVRQTAEFKKDMIFSPEQILSHMSQGKKMVVLIAVVLIYLAIRMQIKLTLLSSRD